MPEIRVAEGSGVGVLGQGRPSEDRVVVLDDAVVVLDGATNLTPGLPSGGWYADRLAEQLGAGLRAAPDRDLAALLEDAIREVATAHELVPGASPSSTVAIARWTQDRVDALVLADSPVVAFAGGQARPLVDDRLSRLPASRHTYPQLLRSGAGYGEELAGALRTGMATTAQRYRNREHGFWVAEADPAAAGQAVQASWDRRELDGLLLATDGVSCGVDEYGLFDWPEAFALARAEGPGAVLAAVRHAELEDPDGLRWPRPKRHDDQLLVLVDGL
ncbi:protein phosphatase 2C domain-containing protein [Amycolatopsis sp. A133]|uniref:protein phosphatase 2C domain-containing protein n=1 Tax=Amycolatopsis sp. A133 TaxID=3064472 RepID=UPI0027EB15B4|nr:protein phosphatase 2C domain-containing protein [Amycolatopsis sp. A133]MDQ7808992.1 protein phosphatase 2C domain-containing protein [Amycolatopsis sp. A133]